MKKTISITPLMSTVGIPIRGEVIVNEKMSGLEPVPQDDWLYLCLLSLQNVSKRNTKISTIANIGSGNGIETIAELTLFKNARKIIVTDILSDILPLIKKNIEKNSPLKSVGIKITYIAGRDCEPLGEKVDLIYGNLPLIMVNNRDLKRNRATTTLTELKSYSHLIHGKNDLLEKYSLISQLGFLLSAKEKLTKNGIIITLLGGRVPSRALAQLFKKAGLKYRELFCAFKRQSDPQFLKQYAQYEKSSGAIFDFYDYTKASELIQKTIGKKVPDVLNCSGNKLKKILETAHLTAAEAYSYSRSGKPIGHIAFAFEAHV